MTSICLFLSILTGMAVGNHLRIDKFSGMFITYVGLAAVSLLAAMFGALYHFSLLLVAVLITGTCIYLRSFSTKEFFPYLAFFITCFLVLSFRNNGAEFHIWDDFSYWGLVAREIFLNGRIPFDNPHLSYLNYIPIFGSFIGAMQNATSFGHNIFNEGDALLVQGTFLLITISVISTEIAGQNRMKWFFCFSLFYLAAFSVVHGFRTLMIDGVLALVFLVSLILGHRHWLLDDKPSLILFLVSAGFLGFLKPSAIGYSVIVAVFFVFGFCDFRSRYKSKLALIFVVTLIIVLTKFYLWQVDINLGKSSHTTFSLTKIIGEFDGFRDTVVRVFQSFYSPFYSGSQGGFSKIGFCVFITHLILPVLCWSELLTKRFVLVFYLASAAFCACLAVNYATNMSSGEAADLHSFDRYAGTFVIGMTGMHFYLVSVKSQKVWSIIFSMLVIIISDFKGVGYFSHPLSHSGRIQQRESIAMVDGGVDRYKKIVFDSFCDSGQAYLMTRFDFRDHIVELIDTCGLTDDEANALLQDRQGVDFLVVSRRNPDDFRKQPDRSPNVIFVGND